MWLGVPAMALLIGGTRFGAHSPTSTPAQVQPVNAVAENDCLPQLPPISDVFTSYGSMRSHSREQPLIPADVEDLGADRQPDGFGVSASLPPGTVELKRINGWESDRPQIAVGLFGDVQIRDGMTFSGFQLLGGVVVKELPTYGVDAERVVAEVGARAQVLQLGKQRVAMVVGDETLGPGDRQLGLFWSDGTEDWSAVASLSRISPEALLTLVAGLYC